MAEVKANLPFHLRDAKAEARPTCQMTYLIDKTAEPFC